MSDAPFGLVEIALAFGAVLAWAAWEIRRNRRELARLKARDARDGKERTGPTA